MTEPTQPKLMKGDRVYFEAEVTRVDAHMDAVTVHLPDYSIPITLPSRFFTLLERSPLGRPPLKSPADDI